MKLTRVTEYFEREEDIRFAKEQIERHGDVAVLRRQKLGGIYTGKVAYFKRTPACRKCGCTEDRACIGGPLGTCAWANKDKDLCTSCG